MKIKLATVKTILLTLICRRYWRNINHNTNKYSIMKIKIHIQHHYTKRDVYGNVYHAVTITNVKNGKSFTANAASLSNVTSILGSAFGAYTSEFALISEECTGSARTSSLPDSDRLDQCRYKADWKKALNSIGLRPRGQVQA